MNLLKSVNFLFLLFLMNLLILDVFATDQKVDLHSADRVADLTKGTDSRPVNCRENRVRLTRRRFRPKEGGTDEVTEGVKEKEVPQAIVVVSSPEPAPEPKPAVPHVQVEGKRRFPVIKL